MHKHDHHLLMTDLHWSPLAYLCTLNPLIAGVARRLLTPLFSFSISPPSNAHSSPVSPPLPAQKRLHCGFNDLYPPYAPHHAACGTASALLRRAAPPLHKFLSNAQACAGIAGVMRGGTPLAQRGCMRAGISICISALRLQSS